MTTDTDLRERLERELSGLPSAAPTVYLAQGRRARRRRRAVGAGAVAALAVVAAQVLAPSSGHESSVAEEPTAPPALSADPDYVAPEPNNPVEAVDGLEGVDWFTTEDAPAGAEEYGRHGPVALTPEGRLWVAPDAVVRRTVIDPFPAGEKGVAASYAVEARYSGAPEDAPGGVVWVIISTQGTTSGTGTMDVPGRWTDDFELWVDDVTSFEQGRPSFAERMLRFADSRTSEVEPGAEGVELLHVRRDPELGSGWVQHSRATAAEVSHGGLRWFVMAVDPQEGAPWYQVYPADTASDFEAFLARVREGWL